MACFDKPFSEVLMGAETSSNENVNIDRSPFEYHGIKIKFPVSERHKQPVSYIYNCNWINLENSNVML